MNTLDKIMRKERQQRYKRLRKLFKARDMASPYVKNVVPVSRLDKYFCLHEEQNYFIAHLAKRMVDEHQLILGARIKPLKPPQKRRPVFTINKEE